MVTGHEIRVRANDFQDYPTIWTGYPAESEDSPSTQSAPWMAFLDHVPNE